PSVLGRKVGGLVLLCLLSTVLCGPALAQPVPADTTAAPGEAATGEAALEALTEDDISGDPTELLELLVGLQENPLDVNRATATELALVPAFSPLLAQAIVRYREANGPFGSLPELQRVEGVSADVYLLARPYLRIGERLEV